MMFMGTVVVGQISAARAVSRLHARLRDTRSLHISRETMQDARASRPERAGARSAGPGHRRRPFADVYGPVSLANRVASDRNCWSAIWRFLPSASKATSLRLRSDCSRKVAVGRQTTGRRPDIDNRWVSAGARRSRSAASSRWRRRVGFSGATGLYRAPCRCSRTAASYRDFGRQHASPRDLLNHGLSLEPCRLPR